MGRSTKKGPYVDLNVYTKVERQNNMGRKDPITTWARACTIIPEFVGHTFEVHNGNKFLKVFVQEDMVGHKLGEFSHTKKFTRHGGKMQKELEAAAKQKEVDAAKAAKAEPAAAAPAKK
jgi:small subunit ribosomal protein S19